MQNYKSSQHRLQELLRLAALVEDLKEKKTSDFFTDLSVGKQCTLGDQPLSTFWLRPLITVKPSHLRMFFKNACCMLQKIMIRSFSYFVFHDLVGVNAQIVNS